MSNWFIVSDGGDIHVLHRSEFANNSAAVPLLDYMKSTLDDINASFYLYLSEFPFRDEVVFNDEDVFPVLEKAVAILDGMSKEDVYNELCEYKVLDVLFTAEAKLLMSQALKNKAEQYLAVAEQLSH